MQIGNLSGRAHMSLGLRRQVSILTPRAPTLGAILTDVEMTEALGALLDQKVAAIRTADGRVDMRDLAYEILNVARPSAAMQAQVAAIHGQKMADMMPAMLEDAAAVHALSLVLTEAFEMQQGPDGKIKMNDVAAHVLAVMRKHPKK